MIAAKSEWLDFELLPKRRSDQKTCEWAVIGKRNKVVLGHVRWFGRWRQYVFYPAAGTLFNVSCLRDIEDFCNGVKKERHVTA